MSHYFFTINRIENVKESFNNNQNIICENKEIRKAAQTITINKKLGWMGALEIPCQSDKIISRIDNGRTNRV